MSDYDYRLNKKSYDEIKEWIKDKNRKILLVYGRSGCGKSRTIRQVIKDNNSCLMIHDCLNFKNSNNILSSISNNHLNKYFYNKETFIVLDEIYSIPNVNSELTKIKNNFDFKNNSLICVTCNLNLPKISGFKKTCHVIKFEDTLDIGILCEKFNLKMTMDCKKYIKENYDNDISSIENAFKIFENAPKKISLKKFTEKTHVEIKTENIQDIIRMIFSKNLSHEKLSCYFSFDSNVLTFLLQENYISNNDDIHKCSEIAESLSEGDVVNRYVYNNHWQLYDYLQYYNFIVPVSATKKSKKVKIKASYYMASKPTSNRLEKSFRKIEFIFKYNIPDSFYIQKIININIDKENYEILKILYHKKYKLSQYELIKFVNSKLPVSKKNKIKKYWKDI